MDETKMIANSEPAKQKKDRIPFYISFTYWYFLYLLIFPLLIDKTKMIANSEPAKQKKDRKEVSLCSLQCSEVEEKFYLVGTIWINKVRECSWWENVVGKVLARIK